MFTTKSIKKLIFLKLWDGAKRLKSQNLQKTHLGPILNLNTEFQISGLSWRRHVRETNLKNKKTHPKDIFGAVRDETGMKSRNFQKAHLWPPTNSAYQIQACRPVYGVRRTPETIFLDFSRFSRPFLKEGMGKFYLKNYVIMSIKMKVFSTRVGKGQCTY